MKRRHFGLPTDDDGGLECEYCSVVGWVDGRSFGWCLLGVGDVLAGDHHGGASRSRIVSGNANMKDYCSAARRA